MYKDTTINGWIGEIPKSWEIRKVKNIFTERIEKGFPLEPLLVSSQKYGVILKSEYQAITGNKTTVATVNLESLKFVEEGDFIISLRSFQGGIEYAYNRGIISPAYVIFREKEDICKNYYRFLFKDTMFIQDLNTLNSGIREGQTISYRDFREKILPLPPYETQKNIASYLDTKISQIQKLLDDKNKTIKLLREKKQRHIYDAVTGGFYKKEQLEDTNLNFIPKIPSEWEMTKLKYCLDENNGGTWGDINVNGTEVLRSTEITIDGEWKIIDPAKIGLDKRDAIKKSVKEGDLILTKSSGSESHIGKTALVDSYMESVGYCYSNFMQRLKPNISMYSKYLWYFLNSSVCRYQYIILTKSTSGLGNLSGDVINEISIPKPSLKQQKDIVENLDKKLGIIDLSIQKIKEELILIEEYKKSLIYNAVTGKITVS